MFRNRSQLVPWRIENGQKVEAHALVTLYEARGDFQLNIEGLRRAGIGALFEAFARLRGKLESEGLFAAQRKRALPRFPRRIGIITSPQAAALQDVLTALQRRAPHLPAILFPTPVQGDGAAEKIAAAIAQAGNFTATGSQDASIDVLIVTRGGGSYEDLWAFNEEVVARAIVASPVPVVCGIGHETDIGIADLVADQRAATPTAAAELVSAGWFGARQELSDIQRSLQRSMHLAIETRMQRLDLLEHRLVHPGARLARIAQALDHLAIRLQTSISRRVRLSAHQVEQLELRIARARPQASLASARARLDLIGQQIITVTRRYLVTQRNRIEALGSALALLNPQATLERGFSIVRDSNGGIVRASSQLVRGDSVLMLFASGKAHGTIDDSSP